MSVGALDLPQLGPDSKPGEVFDEPPQPEPPPDPCGCVKQTDLGVEGGALEADDCGDAGSNTGAWHSPVGGGSDDAYAEDATYHSGESGAGLRASDEDVAENDDAPQSRCLQRLCHSASSKWEAFLSTATGAELAALTRIAAPISLGFVSFNVVGLVNLAFLGHLGEAELAAAALGQLISNMTGNAVMVGVLTAMDTLCAQAYGAGNLMRVGLIAQRATVVCCALSIPILVFWATIGPLLRACGIAQATTTLSVIYLRVRV